MLSYFVLIKNLLNIVNSVAQRGEISSLVSIDCVLILPLRKWVSLVTTKKGIMNKVYKIGYQHTI